ncbi:Hypothetical predicted protein [Lecanosticta acicola]|uniref:Uncharacterized protein n=1 Tax=Lecanosticta acicola TaxID=111012 RepID=A0AAI9EAP5_9PEZI|nr:Hypothetical predicted protein [Lecanosticta acicola]
MSSDKRIATVLLTAETGREDPTATTEFDKSLALDGFHKFSITETVAQSLRWVEAPLSAAMEFPVKLAKAPRLDPEESSSEVHEVARTILLDFEHPAAQEAAQGASARSLTGDVLVARVDGEELLPAHVLGLEQFMTVMANQYLWDADGDQLPSPTDSPLKDNFTGARFARVFDLFRDREMEDNSEWVTIPNPVTGGMVEQEQDGKDGKDFDGEDGVDKEAEGEDQDEPVTCVLLTEPDHPGDVTRDRLHRRLAAEGIVECFYARSDPQYLDESAWKLSPVSVAMGLPLLVKGVKATDSSEASAAASRKPLSPINKRATLLFLDMNTTSSAFGRHDVTGRGQELRGGVVLMRPGGRRFRGTHVKALLRAIEHAVERGAVNPLRRDLSNLFTRRLLRETFEEMREEEVAAGSKGWSKTTNPVSEEESSPIPLLQPQGTGDVAEQQAFLDVLKHIAAAPSSNARREARVSRAVKTAEKACKERWTN